jgi:hypothetical protein
MVAVFAVQRFHMKGDTGMKSHAFKELFKKLGIHIPDFLHGKRNIHNQIRTIAYIHYHTGQGFIHRHITAAVASYTAFVFQSFFYCRSQNDARIFYRMMSVHVNIPCRRNF